MRAVRANAILCLTLVSLGSLVGGAASEPRLQPAGDLHVVDSRGRQVGRIISIEDWFGLGTPIVAVRVGNQRFPMALYQGMLAGNGNQAVQFESADCGGQGFIDPFHSQPPHTSILPSVVAGLRRLYVQSGPKQTATLKSNIDLLAPEGDVCNSFPGSPDTNRTVVPARLLIDNLDSQFTPPFRVE